MPLDSATGERAAQPLADLSAEITTLAAHLHAATYRLLVLIEEFDRRGGWGEWGVLSCAHWLSWNCGIDLGAAREKVRVARCLPHLPQIADAFRKGEVSYSKVRAMTRVATPENEDYLLMIARHGSASHVERLVRGFRRVLRTMEREHTHALHEAREADVFWDDDGMLVVNARLTPEQGAVFVKALEAAREARFRERAAAQAHDDASAPGGVSAEVSCKAETAPDTHSARRADALVAMAESFLDHGLAGAGTAERHQVVLHVTAAATRSPEPGIFDACTLEAGPPIAGDTARRLGCDASLVRMVESAAGEPLDVGRRMRTVPPAIRRALERRDGGCRFPGCTNRRHVDAHHVHHWADGGETSLQNLVLLCRRHHRLVHEGGFAVRAVDGARHLVFSRRDGEAIPRVPPPLPPPVFDVAHLVEAHRIAALEIAPETCVPIGNSATMDEAMAVDGVLQASGYALHVDPPVLRDGATVPGTLPLAS
jgi:hypothetical protein